MKTDFSCWLPDRINRSKVFKGNMLEGGHHMNITHDNVYEVAVQYVERLSTALIFKPGERVHVSDHTGYIHILHIIKTDNGFTVNFLH